jgi:hypothetical protein
MNKRKNLMLYAEEVAYSSKGHFKAADWARIFTQLCIALPLILSIVLIVYQDMAQAWSRLLNCVSMTFSLIAIMSPLVNNQEQAHKKTAGHMILGNAYLDLYSQIRDLSTEEIITKEHLEQVAKRKRELDSQTSELRIPLVPRLWSKLCIKKEMNLDWIYKE